MKEQRPQITDEMLKKYIRQIATGEIDKAAICERHNIGKSHLQEKINRINQGG